MNSVNVLVVLEIEVSPAAKYNSDSVGGLGEEEWTGLNGGGERKVDWNQK